MLGRGEIFGAACGGRNEPGCGGCIGLTGTVGMDGRWCSDDADRFMVGLPTICECRAGAQEVC